MTNPLPKTNDLREDINSINIVLKYFQAWSSTGLQIEGYLLTCIGQDLCKACRFEPKEFHGAKYKQPFSENFPKLELRTKYQNS